MDREAVEEKVRLAPAADRVDRRRGVADAVAPDVRVELCAVVRKRVDFVVLVVTRRVRLRAGDEAHGRPCGIDRAAREQEPHGGERGARRRGLRERRSDDERRDEAEEEEAVRHQEPAVELEGVERDQAEHHAEDPHPEEAVPAQHEETDHGRDRERREVDVPVDDVCP